MSYCWNCGTELKEIVDKCPECDKNQSRDLSDMLTAQSGMLDFYSDRAVAHASFLVANIFGLVTLLAIVQAMIQQPPNPIITVCGTPISLIHLSLIPFWAFGCVGYHNLQRFGSYASLAQKLFEQLLRFGDFILEANKKKRVKFSCMHVQVVGKSQKGGLRQAIWKSPNRLTFAYLCIIATLSLVVYCGSENVILRVGWIFAITFLFIVCLRTL